MSGLEETELFEVDASIEPYNNGRGFTMGESGGKLQAANC